jgi:hypothetical protein
MPKKLDIQGVFFPKNNKKPKGKGPVKIHLSRPPNVQSNIYNNRYSNMLKSRDKKEKGRLLHYENKIKKFAVSKYA